ncbi:MAG TPA: hypothetical protein VFO10_07695 [Oligoflexus sp.]|uniref:hypothetical protein n=1 Tax=Oligoflexus sp. TaxID=1971216 RepID=UPI002D80E374|nr:hypothetical protein [Oligoflexus sp.]HET9237117.1 hypothetical protein [Oligoflexus sp.]
MKMKKKGLNAVLALGIAFTQTLAMANPAIDGSEVVTQDDSLLFTETFQTVSSYVTENGDGTLSVEIPAEVLETLDQAVYADLVASLAAHNASTSTNEGQDQLRIPFAKKLIIIGLKHGGPVVKKIVSKVSPKAGKWIGKYADKLAKFLEDLENWAELPIITFLVKNGVPPADAKIMAEIIVALL